MKGTEKKKEKNKMQKSKQAKKTDRKSQYHVSIKDRTVECLLLHFLSALNNTNVTFPPHLVKQE